MPGRFSGNGSVIVGADKTLLTLISAATIRPKLYELWISCGATPADVTTIFHLERFTAAGTEGSGFSPHELDPVDAGLELADYGVGVFGVEPTYTADAILLRVAVHQKTAFRWGATRAGSEFVAPATAANGIGLQSQSSGGTAAHDVTMFHTE